MKPDLRRTGRAIAAIQRADGSVPWEQGRHVDPWNHVEALMGLDTVGEHAAARRGYLWLAGTQRSDGAWPAAYVEGVVFDPTLDANFVAYVAVGVWHHYMVTDDRPFLEAMWPVVRRALDFVVDLQMPTGQIAWARDAQHRAWPGGLLTSSACILLSLDRGIDVAEEMRAEAGRWAAARARLASAVRTGSGFEPKEHYAMDWYYPVLGGALVHDEAVLHLQSRWDEFVRPGHGCACVCDREWVTAGETAELALACLRAGLDVEAMALLDQVEALRAPDGLYWTGVNLSDGVFWPPERTTWSAGAVLLARAASANHHPTAKVFATSPSGAGLSPSVRGP